MDVLAGAFDYVEYDRIDGPALVASTMRAS